MTPKLASAFLVLASISSLLQAQPRLSENDRFLGVQKNRSQISLPKDAPGPKIPNQRCQWQACEESTDCASVFYLQTCLFIPVNKKYTEEIKSITPTWERSHCEDTELKDDATACVDNRCQFVQPPPKGQRTFCQWEDWKKKREEQCERDAPSSCELLAMMEELEGDREAAKKIASSGCDSGDPDMCYRAAINSGSAEEAKKWFSKGCEGGNAGACFDLAEIELLTHPARSISFFNRLCEEDDPLFCQYAGFRVGALKDREMQRDFFNKGCQKGLQTSCVQRDHILKTKGK